MRSPLRIAPFLRALESTWQQVPDERFGQLIWNLTRDAQGRFTDPWEWEDGEWLRRMDAYYRRTYPPATPETRTP